MRKHHTSFILLCILLMVILLTLRFSNSLKTKRPDFKLESGADKQMASWFWSRGYPDPTHLNKKYHDAWMEALAMRRPENPSTRAGSAGSLQQNLFSGNWVSIGPNQNIGGRILCVAVDPQNSNNIVIGSASGGMWKSTSAGIGTNAWQPIHLGQPVLGVSSILINPTNSNILYAGTGEVYRTNNSNIGFNVWKARGTYGVGVLKSVNGGISWSVSLNRNLDDLFGIQMLEFDPSNSNIVYACATDGLYRTSDAGASWNKILDKIYVTDVVIHPANSNLILAAVGNLLNSDKGIYRSTNGGASWSKVSTGLPASFEGFIRLDNIELSPDMVVASIGRDAGNLNELYRSTDFGSTWSVLSNSNHCRYQFWFSHDVAIDPSNSSRLMMGGVPLYTYSITSGMATSIGGVHADIHDIEYDPNNSSVVYVASDGGVYRSTNGGSSFSPINGGLHAVQFYASFATSPVNPDLMVGGLQDNGVVRYNGSSWSKVVDGDGGPCLFHPTNGNVVFASNDARRLWRSNNGAASFPSEVLSSWAFDADSRTGFMAPIAISKSNPSVMYVASDNLHKSSSGGIAGSWTGNNYSSAFNFIEAQHKTAVALAVSPTNENKLFVSTSPFAQYDNNGNNLHVQAPPNLFRSINGGNSFANIKSGLPDRFVMDFAINPNDDDSVWIVLGGFGTSHVYLTPDGGNTWINRGVGLPDVPTNAILLDPQNTAIIYVGNDLGVYVSADAGNTWTDFNNGLWDATLIMDLAVTADQKLVAATHGKGAFISDMFTSSIPVTLGNFTAHHENGYNLLRWVTSSEQNTSRFEIERSNDGSTFNKIGVVSATNNPLGSSYIFKDTRNLDGATIFYRLKLIDADDSYEYSRVVLVRMPTIRDLTIAVSNGQTIRVIFDNKFRQNMQILLYTATGQQLIAKKVEASPGINNIPINIRGNAGGVYVVELKTMEWRISKKISAP